MLLDRPLRGAGVGLTVFYEMHRLNLAVALIAAGLVAGILVGAQINPEGVAENDAHEFAGGFAGWTALGLMAGTLFLGWGLTGIPLMAGLRRHRVGLHTWTSVTALALAVLHGIALNRAGHFEGTLSGWVSTAMMLGLFLTGWWRTELVLAWGLKPWRWVHWLLAGGAILIGLQHWALIEARRPPGM